VLPHILFQKYIYILSLEMASPGNQHCANGIGKLRSLFTRFHSDKHFSEFYLQDGGNNQLA